ncbi:MAG: hypothetical protein COV67_00185 [Nitrospinae bacterium CG11_big_fil_rev_8_21_14_0_20_56_8]|nr:MAG: hypothetical protein COV67_00185 [Nitrospinae bacterium CG11_big_fil_rev_8_21_14_0_20_56_8]
MPVLENELREYTQLVWQTLLDLEVVPSPDDPIPLLAKDWVTACVQIMGEWTGLVVLETHPDLARTLAGKMFFLEPGEITTEEIKDSQGELINMVGGNIKALLPEPNYLSVPIVALEGHSLFFPGTIPVTQICFLCEEQKFRVSLLQPTTRSRVSQKIQSEPF